jgi:hypothetical protein
MIKLIVTAACLTVANATSLAAQPIPVGMKVGLALYLSAAYGGLKAELIEAAQVMPEADYGFKPGPAPEMRTYGQLFAHVATGQFGTCAAIKERQTPVKARTSNAT